ncbi:MAG: MFS transporter [Bacteroidetes bacterium]|nr:MAG: MFS transporter [Bacteroidota bacterium]
MNKFLQFFATGKDIPQIKDSAEINSLYKKNRMKVLLSITFGYGLLYTSRLALSIVKKPLIDGGIFDANDLGLIGSGIFYGYAFGKLINGVIADHVNAKRFMAVGIFMSAIVNLLMGWTILLWLWIVLWAINGWFQGYGAPSSVVSLTNWFSNRERGRYYGIWSSSHSIGEGLTFVVIAAFVSYFGWQAGFITPGILGIFVALAVYYFLQDRPQTLGLPPIADWTNDHAEPIKEKPVKNTFHSQLKILKMPSIWIIGLASATMYITRYAISSWGILYLQEEKGFSLIEAGSILGVHTIAGIVGCIAYGYISDKMFHAKRPPVTLIFGLLEILAISVIFFGPEGNTVLLTAAFILYGFTLSGLLAVLGGLFAVDIAPKNASGAVLGFIGVFSYLSAAMQEQISGFLIENGKTVIDGVNKYDFSNVLIFWVGASVVSMILAASLWRVKISD